MIALVLNAGVVVLLAMIVVLLAVVVRDSRRNRAFHEGRGPLLAEVDVARSLRPGEARPQGQRGREVLPVPMDRAS